MIEDFPLEPNEIADTYQALSEYHQLVSRLAAAHENLTGETKSTLNTFADLIGDKRAEFGEATATRNTFTMEEYRDKFDEELQTINTEGLTPSEREPLEQLKIIDYDETFRIPCRPRTGERLNIWPLTEGLNVDYGHLQEFTVPSKSITLFHFSDTHLGYQNRTKTGGGGNTEWVSRSDSVGAFQAVLQQAIKEDVDAIVHTGDLFDHDVDQDTLQAAVSSIETLAEHETGFYYILGDHDRLATGGDIPLVANAVDALNELSKQGTARHCTTAGTPVGESTVTMFGVDATGIGYSEIQAGYTLSGWSPADITLDTSQTSGTNILCLHESLGEAQISEIIERANQQNQPLDLILIGDSHSPPFDGEWQTKVDGIPVASAGPPIPVSNYFDDHPIGYNRIRIGTNGNLGVDRRELT